MSIAPPADPVIAASRADGGAAEQPGPLTSEAWKNVAGYAAAAVFALAAAAAVLQLWRADLRVPLFYAGDNLMAQMFVQNILDTGSVYDNPRLGAPYAMDMRDYPIPDILHTSVIWLLGRFSSNSALVMNLSYLLAFPLIGLSAYWTLRRLRMNRLIALVPAVLYTCLPYHFFRIRGHVFLSSYFLVPPMIWVILCVALGRNPLLRIDRAGAPPRWNGRSRAAAGTAVLCVLTGLAGVYYAFFSCALLVAAGVRAAFRDRRWKTLAAAAVPVGLIAGVTAAALSPSVLYQALHGKNVGVAARVPAEADMYGLGVSYLLMPVSGHRLPWLAGVMERFMAAPRTPPGEWPFLSLGVIGAGGFLYLIGRFLWRGGRAERIDDGLAYLNLSAVLLSTVGGFGSLFAFWVSPSIRCYSRISIFIAFFALAALFLGVQRLTERFGRGPRGQIAWAAGLFVLLVLGVLDQTTTEMTPDYAETRRQFASDEDLGRRMEAALPAGSMVYEMPFMYCPEAGPVEAMGDHEPLRPFFHTRTLRFSYGAMGGRPPGRWHEELSHRPLSEVVEQLALAGFAGVHLDRAGYADRGTAAVAELTSLLGAAPLAGDERHVFFDITSYARTIRTEYSDDEWEKARETVLHPFSLEWHGAFGVPEQSPAEGRWRWSGPDGKLRLVNPSARTRKVVLKMECSGLWDQTVPSRLVVDGLQCRRELSLTAERVPLELELDVPPGEHALRFTCDGRGKRAAEGKTVVFRLWNFDYRVVE